MSAETVFLQSTLDSTSRIGSPLPLNIDELKKKTEELIKEQKKECHTLHNNPLFKEFRAQKDKRIGRKGYRGMIETPPAFDDIDAEAQSRMIELIRHTALSNDKPLKGVWALFGEPYVCLGEPHQPKHILPKLYRDEVVDKDLHGNQNSSAAKAAKLTAKQRAQQAAVADAEKPITQVQEQETPEHLDQAEKLLAYKHLIKFNTLDKQEASFPLAPLIAASNRRVRAAVTNRTHFVDREAAEREAEDPISAYGALVNPTPHLQATTPQLRPFTTPTHLAEENSSSTVFITQTGGDTESVESRQRTFSIASHSQHHDSSSVMAAYAPLPQRPPSPKFQLLTSRVEPIRVEKENPVYRWHNDFKEVRHKGRISLSKSLQERSDGRRKARSYCSAAANLTHAILDDLDDKMGYQQAHAVPGVQPISPYSRMEAYNQAQALKNNSQPNVVMLQPELLQLIHYFYDQLCALVETQRMGDPMSLMIIHKVKSLLESGIFLHRPLLTHVLNHISEFVTKCGLNRYNKCTLPILTFIAKCVEINPEIELVDMVVNAGLTEVVYGGQVPLYKPGTRGSSRVGSVRIGTGSALNKGGSKLLPTTRRPLNLQTSQPSSHSTEALPSPPQLQSPKEGGKDTKEGGKDSKEGKSGRPSKEGLEATQPMSSEPATASVMTT